MVIDDQGRIICLIPLFLTVHKELGFIKTRWLNTGNYLYSGPLFAPWLSSNECMKILEFLMCRIDEIARHLKVDKIWISYPSITGEETALNHYGYFPLRHFGYKEKNVVSMIKDLGGDVESLFRSLKPNCRKNIRRCKEEGGTFYQILERSEWFGCYDLNVQTLGSKAYTLKVMEIIWDQFVKKGIATITCIRHEDKIISVMVTTGISKSCYYWIGFNCKPQAIPGVGNLLLWETMLLYKKMGFRFFEIGSMEFTPGKQKDISRFKESFNGTPTYLLSGDKVRKCVKKDWIVLLRSIHQNLKKNLDIFS